MRLSGSAVLVSLSSTALAFNCQLQAGGVGFDLRTLKGPYSVVNVEETSPMSTNTTWTINPCGPIEKDKVDPDTQCPKEAQVCGIQRIWKKDGTKSEIYQIIPIAGEFDGRSVDEKFTRLKMSNLPGDAKKEGIRMVLGGGVYAKKKQQAVVEFLCDPQRTGLEGMKPDKEESDGKEKREERKEPEKKEPEERKPEEEQSLKFISYDTSDPDRNVLKLEWKTKHACEKLDEGSGGVDQGHHWGFFTWFIIILFLGVAAYLIFGSWLNYNRYGSRGWDLLPHSDTIRDLPYLLKDWCRRVVGTLQGRGGGRGEYSAV